MNEPENQILKSEIFKEKKKEKMPCFLFKLRGSYKATLFCFRFSKRLLSDCHSSLSCKESVISVFNSRLPQFFDQNTKQDNTLCSRVNS